MEIEGVALVTGASRGIGRAVALELARRGFEVVASMRDPRAGIDLAQEAEQAGNRLRIEQLDVEEPDSIRIPKGLRVLVNNAGIEGPYLPVEEAPLALWRRIFETNVFGLVEVTRRAIPTLRASGGGVVCNLTSASLLFPMPFYAAYRASKAAVQALGESLRAELAPFGIRVVEILPGPIDTDMLSGSDRPPEALSHAPYRRRRRGHRRVHSRFGGPAAPRLRPGERWHARRLARPQRRGVDARDARRLGPTLGRAPENAAHELPRSAPSAAAGKTSNNTFTAEWSPCA
jgi:NAD(P)-dependent dehydrogenase (short-subunit alcohol dehydrogenase family)